ncbi:hypothetical protein F2981_18995 (plasmid) [Sinorhizobium meliloti]|nr:hypothetical protein [Sinorhizobium meliloti]
MGNALRFHPMLKVAAEFIRKSTFLAIFDPVHQVKEFEPNFGMGCSISSQALLAMALANGRLPHACQNRWRHMGIYYVRRPADAPLCESALFP